jgi:hypothetical protein
MYPFRYVVSLRIWHPRITAEAICNRLDCEPRRKWTAGTRRENPEGSPLPGFNETTYCSFDLEHAEEDQLVDFLKNCNDRFYALKDYFEEIRSTGGSLEYFIGWFSDTNSGSTFDVELMSKLVELRIDLSIDFYGGPDHGKKRPQKRGSSRKRVLGG